MKKKTEPKDVVPRDQLDKKKLRHLNYLHELYQKGFPLPEKDLINLEVNGFIKIERPEPEVLPKKGKESETTHLPRSKSAIEKQTDDLVDIIEDGDCSF